MTRQEDIWYKDPSHLFTQSNYYVFFPSKDMSFAEQLNSFVRLSIYFSLIVFLLQKDVNIFIVPLFMGAFTYFLYSVDTENKHRETLKLEQENLEEDKHTKEICQKPTKNNPFMNVLVSDYVLNPEKKKACNISKSSVKQKAQEYFDSNLYRSVSDVFNKEASDRQWITNPITTIPNDADKFARWCYGVGKTCKEGNGNKCYVNTYRNVN
jgi:hypothetical protein